MSTSYKHFSTEERESLLVMLTKNMKRSEMAKALGRSASSISRELKRNRSEDGSYSPFRAENAYRARRRSCGRKRKLDDPELKAAVEENLKAYWSPEEIDGRRKLEEQKLLVSYQTIYRSYDRGELNVPKDCFRRKRRPNTPHDTEKRGRIHDAGRAGERRDFHQCGPQVKISGRGPHVGQESVYSNSSHRESIYRISEEQETVIYGGSRERILLAQGV